MKILMLIPLLFTACSCTQPEQPIEVVEEFPRPSNSAKMGAYQMPYSRYDSQNGTLQGGASLIASTNFDKLNIASQASNQEYVVLQDTSASISLTVTKKANGLTVRFNLPDDIAKTGVGVETDMLIFVNGQKVQTISLTSYWAYQYFNKTTNKGVPYPNGTGDRFPMMCFDESHTLLATEVNPGDVIMIKKGISDYALGIDFIELEWVGNPIARPSNALSVTEYGAVANDGNDDYQAIVNCITAATAQGKIVYFPPGRFDINQCLWLLTDGTKLQGAGMWYTNLYFSNSTRAQGGLYASAANLRLSDIYLNTANFTRMDNGVNRGYHGIGGAWSGDSSIDNVWIEHFGAAIWLAEYGVNPRISTIHISNSRIRNNYADGINLANGTSNSIVEHCDIRNSGDDCLVTFASRNGGNNPTVGSFNTFRYCTVEFGWRGGGIAIIGGKGHKAHNIIVKDMMGSAGVRFVTDFDQYPFDPTPTTPVEVYDCQLIKCGSQSTLYDKIYGAITFKGKYPKVTNVLVSNVKVCDAQACGVWLDGVNVDDVTLQNVLIDGAGRAGGSNNYAVYADSGSASQTGFKVTLKRFSYNNCPGGFIKNVNNSFNIIVLP